ncbi:putative 3-dehydroquinate dehydratase [Bradyrhizobium sp. STM 3843]|uniref:type II 3-dehydroquinate dehydratase n=1 Tax=Bradyrhizobium sp. STM 3843 TaxID=551947 RepID=UPI00024055D1|nr:type II 3-dehydroquinate dehydratase [Bradyrhizobium sp. STM 3843]CCE10635.1 putative 3-dehydroquinate dehydratase [Bradyrhizobium sp. STM 3843]
MSRLVYVLNGPNLNLLGKRQPHIYGHETLTDVERDCHALAKELGLDFHSGALGTVNVSDTIQSPWSWEFTAGENPAYSHTPETCYQIGGTRASLAIPQLDLWRHPSKASWWAPIKRERLSYEREDPLGLQIVNFCGVIRSTAAPVVSGHEGLKTLRVIDAVERAAETGDLVSVSGGMLGMSP